MSMEVAFACNDERGQFTGKAECIEIADMRLECTLLGGGVQMKIYEEGKKLLKVGRVVLPFIRYRYGAGNWCWDGYLIPEADILRLIHYLQRQKYWQCIEGPCELYDKFNAKQPFTEADLRSAA